MWLIGNRRRRRNVIGHGQGQVRVHIIKRHLLGRCPKLLCVVPWQIRAASGQTVYNFPSPLSTVCRINDSTTKLIKRAIANLHPHTIWFFAIVSKPKGPANRPALPINRVLSLRMGKSPKALGDWFIKSIAGSQVFRVLGIPENFDS